jgi:acetoin utilization deacetylase AcuC-like enzyme
MNFGGALMLPPKPDIARAKKRQRAQRVVIMHSERYQHACSLLPASEHRDDLLHSLIEAYGLLQGLTVVAPALATAGHMRGFHTEAYLTALQQPPEDLDELDALGLTDDCEASQQLSHVSTQTPLSKMRSAI